MQTILVVDDDPDILEVVRLSLELENYHVMVSPSGEAVMGMLQQQLPDLILMDIMLANYDGRAICRQIKAVERYIHIPIILYSASNVRLEEALECGAASFISKPFDLDHLIEEIAHCLLPVGQ